MNLLDFVSGEFKPLGYKTRSILVINSKGATNLPGIFAAGDCTTVPYKQIVVAMGSGSKAALSAFDYLIRTDAAEKELVAA